MKRIQDKNANHLNPLSNSRGFILIFSYLMMSVFSIYSLAFFSKGNAFLHQTERNKNRMIAFNMAEAGIDFTVAQLEANPAYDPGNQYTSLNTNRIQGGYQVQLTTPPGNPEMRILNSVGHVPGNPAGGANLRAYEQRSVTAYIQLEEHHFFDYAIFADDDIRLNGSPGVVVDSYDSRNGPYDPALAGDNGNVGTNSTTAGTVDLIGNATVHGDVEVGPGGDPNAVIDVGPNSAILGSTFAANSEKSYECESTNLVSEGMLNGGNLAGGVYHFDQIKVSGQNSITALGPIVIYVSGNVYLGGQGVATQNNQPPNFLIFLTGNGKVTLAGGSDFYGAIYAPESEIRNVGNGTIYGSLVGETYTQSGNGSVHYDEALEEAGGDGTATANFLAWVENNTSAWGTGQ